MASSLRQVLQHSLEDLSQKELRTFRGSLLDREGEPRVRRRALEDQDEIGIADVLISTFDAQAGRVAVETLQAIECNHVALRLKAKLEELSRLSATSASTARPGEHFVDRHRSALIQRVRRFQPILYKLLALGVLSQEEYDAIMAKPNPQDQAQHLYNGVLTSSGTTGKDIFLSMLEEIEPFLLEDLRNS